MLKVVLGRDDETIQHSWICQPMPRGDAPFGQTDACSTRADNSVWAADRMREKLLFG